MFIPIHSEKWSNLTHIFQMGGSTTKGFLGFLRGRWESVWRWLTPWTLEVTIWGPTFPGGRWGVNWIDTLEDNWNTFSETNSKSTWKLMVGRWVSIFGGNFLAGAFAVSFRECNGEVTPVNEGFSDGLLAVRVPFSTCQDLVGWVWVFVFSASDWG